MREAQQYAGLPDEDFDAKVDNFMSTLALVRVTSEEDKLTALPVMLKDQAALTYRTEIRGKVTTLEDALKRLRATFLSEEAR